MSIVVGETAELPVVLENTAENTIHKQLLTIAAGIVIENNPYFLRNVNRFFGNAAARENILGELNTVLDNRYEDDYEPAIEAVFFNAAYNQFLPKYDPDGSRGLDMRSRFINLLAEKKLIRIAQATQTKEIFVNPLEVEDQSEYLKAMDEIFSNISGYMASHIKPKAEFGLQVLIDEVINSRHERFGEEVKQSIREKALKSFKYVTAIERVYPQKAPKDFRKNVINAFGAEFYQELYGEEYKVPEDADVA